MRFTFEWQGRRCIWPPGRLWQVVLLLFTVGSSSAEIALRNDGFHVYPGDSIQEAIERAGAHPTLKAVKVHAGEYRPPDKRQALIWLNRKHDGVHVEAIGTVTLTAANPAITNSRTPGYPAVVNHVVYFGDGVSSNTVLRGFRITGANRFITEKRTAELEPDTTIEKNMFFYTDGGGIKVFGRSYPTIQRVVMEGNFASPCAGGISIQHEGHNQNWVTIEDSVFRTNRAQVTGAAIDLLHGSAARIRNCLFVGNQSNTGEDVVAKRSGEKPFLNSGVITIFRGSRAILENCTFTGNRNGVDDMGGESQYLRCLFVGNTMAGGVETERYELDLPKGGTVLNNVISGAIRDPLRCVTAAGNILDGDPVRFTSEFTPIGDAFSGVGYRP